MRACRLLGVGVNAGRGQQQAGGGARQLVLGVHGIPRQKSVMSAVGLDGQATARGIRRGRVLGGRSRRTGSTLGRWPARKGIEVADGGASARAAGRLDAIAAPTQQAAQAPHLPLSCWLASAIVSRRRLGHAQVILRHLPVAGRQFRGRRCVRSRRCVRDARQHACRSECLEGQRQHQEADEQRSGDGFHGFILARVTDGLA
jgi:hypothetical protein